MAAEFRGKFKVEAGTVIVPAINFFYDFFLPRVIK